MLIVGRSVIQKAQVMDCLKEHRDAAARMARGDMAADLMPEERYIEPDRAKSGRAGEQIRRDLR